jgi:hypothetical protein
LELRHYALTALAALVIWTTVVFSHEGGHAIAGALMGVDPIAIETDPPLRIITKFAEASVLRASDADWLFISLGGPFAAMTLSLVVLWLGYRLRSSPMGLPLRIIGWMELLGEAINLVPTYGSDGYWVLKALSKLF